MNAAELADAAVYDPDIPRAVNVAEEIGCPWFHSLEAAFEWRPAAAVIAAPHREHVPLARRAVAAGCHVLVEKPLSVDRCGLRELFAEAHMAARRLRVACNLRFHPGPATLARRLPDIGRPLFARAYFGNYLPNMRPGADYRELYCARGESGGGVVLDAIHEIDYLMWLLGPVCSVSARLGRLSDLDIDVEDYAVIALEHDGGPRSEIHLDYLQQLKRRGCELVGTEGTLLWETEGKRPERCRVRLGRRGSEEWEVAYESGAVDNDGPYVEMLRRFLLPADSELQDDGLLDGLTAARVLDVALAARSGEWPISRGAPP